MKKYVLALAILPFLTAFGYSSMNPQIDTFSKIFNLVILGIIVGILVGELVQTIKRESWSRFPMIVDPSKPYDVSNLSDFYATVKPEPYPNSYFVAILFFDVHQSDRHMTNTWIAKLDKNLLDIIETIHTRDNRDLLPKYEKLLAETATVQSIAYIHNLLRTPSLRPLLDQDMDSTDTELKDVIHGHLMQLSLTLLEMTILSDEYQHDLADRARDEALSLNTNSFTDLMDADALKAIDQTDTFFDEADDFVELDAFINDPLTVPDSRDYLVREK